MCSVAAPASPPAALELELALAHVRVQRSRAVAAALVRHRLGGGGDETADLSGGDVDYADRRTAPHRWITASAAALPSSRRRTRASPLGGGGGEGAAQNGVASREFQRVQRVHRTAPLARGERGRFSRRIPRREIRDAGRPSASRTRKCRCSRLGPRRKRDVLLRGRRAAIHGPFHFPRCTRSGAGGDRGCRPVC